MAFKFFRRRQKLVLVLMVLLMVAFLVPAMFQRCDNAGGRDITIGYIGDKEVTGRMVQAAAIDLHLLDHSLRMGMGIGQRLRAGEDAFMAFKMTNRRDAGLAWVLLVHEAGQMGITISDDQIDSFLLESGLAGEAYQLELAELRENRRTEKELRRAISNYLKVTKVFQTVEIGTAPSLPELRHAAGDLYERIELAMVSLPPEDPATDAPEPSDQAITSQFDRHKELAPLARSNGTEFGFGYRIPNRVEVSWLFINEGLVSRGVEPDEKQMMRFWEKNKNTLKNRIPIPTTSPAEADTQPSEPVEPQFREVAFESFSQARPMIRRIFMREAVDIKMDGIISYATRSAQQLSESDEPYLAVAKEMIRPADNILKKKITSLSFSTKASVKSVIEDLEYLSNVKIVYPFGEHEKLTLDGEIEVKMKPWDSITLGEALERVGKEAKYPPIKWVTCAGMENVLFASEPIDLTPVSAGRTGMVGLDQIAQDRLLGQAGLKSTARQTGQSLLSVVEMAEEFLPPGKKNEARIKTGSDYDRAMYVPGLDGGRLLWRLVQAEISHAPEYPTADIRKQIIADLNIVSGFEKTLAVAEGMKAELEKSGDNLKKFADDKKLDFSETGMFSRNRMQYRTKQVFPSYVPGIGIDMEFLKQAFTLVPADPDNPGSDKPLAVIPLRRQRKIMLVQRIGYEPLTSVVFDYWAINEVAGSLILQRWSRTAETWFAYKNVAKRVNYGPK